MKNKNYLNEFLRLWLAKYPDDHEYSEDCVKDQEEEHWVRFESCLSSNFDLLSYAQFAGVKDEIIMEEDGYFTWQPSHDAEEIEVCKENIIQLYQLPNGKYLIGLKIVVGTSTLCREFSLFRESYWDRKNALKAVQERYLDWKKYNNGGKSNDVTIAWERTFKELGLEVEE